MSQVKAQINKVLSGVSNGYVPQGYISDVGLPVLPVDETSGIIGKYTNQHLRKEDDQMGGRGAAKSVNAFGTDNSQVYDVGLYGLVDGFTVVDEANTEKIYSLEKSKTMGLTTKIWLGKESRYADFMNNLANYAAANQFANVGAARFNKFDTSDPIGVFSDMREAVRASGMYPNRVDMPRTVINKLKYHPQIIRGLGYADNRPGALKWSEVQDFLEVEQMHISDVLYNNSKEGQTDVMADIWAKNIHMYYAPSTPAEFQVCFGYRLAFKPQMGRIVKSYYKDNPNNYKEVYVEEYYGYKCTNTKAGAILVDAID